MISALLLAVALPVTAAPHAKPYWIKMYSLAPYQETWTGDLTVKKLDESVPKVVAAIESNGGKLTQPLEIFARSATEQQLSLSVPKKKSKSLLAALRKLGKSADPAVRPAAAAIPLAEVREKLGRLTKDKAENPVALATVPSIAEAVDEMIEHLANVEAVARDTDGAVLWNITVREAR